MGPGGSIAGYRLEEYNLDQINPGRNLLDLEDPDGRLRAAIGTLRAQLRSQPRTEAGGFWHKAIYPSQMWLDGLYMAEPFYARYAIEFGEPERLDDVIRQFSLAEERTRDPATGLLRHAWDESRAMAWADPESGRSPHAWGRAVGWYAMALVDVLEILPPDHGGRSALGAILGRLADAVLPIQDPGTGLWPQVLDQAGREGNYLETSVSAMLAYALAKGSRLGRLDDVRCRAAAERAYGGLIARRLARGEGGEARLEGTCSVAGLGGNPYRDGSFEYYVREPVKTDDFKGVGPFILASIELEGVGTR